MRELQRKLEEICYYIAVKIVENDKEIKNYLITPEALIDILDVNTRNIFLLNYEYTNLVVFYYIF